MTDDQMVKAVALAHQCICWDDQRNIGVFDSDYACSCAIDLARALIEMKKQRDNLYIGLILIKNAGTDDSKRLKEMAADWVEDENQNIGDWGLGTEE